MRSFLLLLITVFSLSPSFLFARNNGGNGTIKGIVTTADGKPAALITIQLKGTKKATVSDENGSFVLTNVKPGAYTLLLH